MDSASSVLSAFIKGSNEEFVAPRSCGWVGEPVEVMDSKDTPVLRITQVSPQRLRTENLRWTIFPRG